MATEIAARLVHAQDDETSAQAVFGIAELIEATPSEESGQLCKVLRDSGAIVRSAI